MAGAAAAGDAGGSEAPPADGEGVASDGVVGARNDMDGAKERIEEFDWEGLEGRFWGRMEECRRLEEGLRGEFGELVEVGAGVFSFVFLLFLLVGSLGGCGWEVCEGREWGL